jgi:hypothetical protein
VIGLHVKINGMTINGNFIRMSLNPKFISLVQRSPATCSNQKLPISQVILASLRLFQYVLKFASTIKFNIPIIREIDRTTLFNGNPIAIPQMDDK